MKTALIVIDYINDITHPTGKISHCASHTAERGAIGKANRALAIGRKRGWLNILVKVGFDRSYVDQPKHSPLFGRAHEFGAIALGTEGTDFHPDLDSSLGDLTIVKPRVSAFYGTNLDAVLRAQKVERLVVAGVSSTLGIQSTVREAHDRDYAVFVVEDACAARSEEDHQMSMISLEAIAKIIRVEDLEGM